MSTESTGVVEGAEQRVGWLELFFDLVFVVVIEQLTHRLHGDPRGSDFAVVTGLAFLAWMSWTNVTGFANLAGGITRERRALVLLSMAAVALMAVAVPEVTGDRSGLFALGYAAARLAMWPLWLTGMRSLGTSTVRPTIYGPGLGALWLVSIAVPDPARWWMWGALGLVEVGLLANLDGRMHFNVSHLVERVGLFVIIVLGESVVQLIRAVDVHETAAAWVVAALGFAMICAFWSMYFDLGSTSTEQHVSGASYALIRDVLMLGHFVVILGLILLAAGLGGAIEEADADHLTPGLLVALCGGAMLYHAAFIFITARYGYPVRYIVPWGVPALVLPLAVMLLGGSWAPWAVVAAILAETLLHGVLGGITVRRATAAGIVRGARLPATEGVG